MQLLAIPYDQKILLNTVVQKQLDILDKYN